MERLKPYFAGSFEWNKVMGRVIFGLLFVWKFEKSKYEMVYSLTGVQWKGWNHRFTGSFKNGIQLWAIFGPSFVWYGVECWKNFEGEMVSSLTCVQWKGWNHILQGLLKSGIKLWVGQNSVYYLFWNLKNLSKK